VDPAVVTGENALAGDRGVSSLARCLQRHACLRGLERPWQEISVTILLTPSGFRLQESRNACQTPEHLPCIYVCNDAVTPRSAMVTINTRLPAVRPTLLREC
jgi:hypothetical protein